MLAPLPMAAVALAAGTATWFTHVGLRDHAEWYRCVSAPHATPPSWVFSTVWTVLYVQQAAALSASQRWSIHVPVLVLETLWCALFFVYRRPVASLAVLLALAAWTAHHRDEFGPLLPYWTLFAVMLNAMAAVRAADDACRRADAPL